MKTQKTIRNSTYFKAEQEDFPSGLCRLDRLCVLASIVKARDIYFPGGTPQPREKTCSSMVERYKASRIRPMIEKLELLEQCTLAETAGSGGGEDRDRIREVRVPHGTLWPDI